MNCLFCREESKHRLFTILLKREMFWFAQFWFAEYKAYMNSSLSCTSQANKAFLVEGEINMFPQLTVASFVVISPGESPPDAPPELQRVTSK